MSDTVLFAAAEALVFRELGICSGCEPCFLYNGSRVEVKPSEYIDDVEPPYFGVRQTASDICVFSLKNGLKWDFYIIRTSVLNSCFAGLSAVSLPMIAPLALHVNVGGVKQAVDLAVEAA